MFLPRYTKLERGVGLDFSNKLNDGIVFEMPLNERYSLDAYDLSGKGNHGGWNGTGEHWVGGVAEFNGTDDYVNVPDDPSLQIDVYTVSFWLSMHFTAGAENVTIIGKDDDDTSKGWGMVAADADNGKLRFYTQTGNIQTAKTSWNQNQWYHIVLVQESDSSAYIYVDGCEDSSGDNGYDGYSTASLKIGFNDFIPGSSEYFDGLIDQVSIWSRALSASEVAALYQNTWQRYQPIMIPYVAAVVGVAPTGVFYGPLIGPTGGPI